MKKYGRFLLIFTAVLFAFSHVAHAAQSLKMQNAKIEKAKIQTNPALAKPVRILPKLTVMGLQVAGTQSLETVRYQVKIRNDSTQAYKGGDTLAFEMQHHYTATNQDVWNPTDTKKEIGPIDPGKVLLINGEMKRGGNAERLKAVVMAGTTIVSTKTAAMPAMPLPDVKITKVECNGSRLLVTIKNNSDLVVDKGIVLQYYNKPTGINEWKPAGGGTIRLQPRAQGQFTKPLGSYTGEMKVNVFHTRSETIKADEKTFNLANCK